MEIIASFLLYLVSGFSSSKQRFSRGQNVTARSQLSRLRPEAKTIGSEATAFKDTVGVEIKVHSTSDSLTGQVVAGILIAFT